MNTIEILIIVTLVWVAFYTIYFNFVRPLVISRAQFWAESVRDEVDLLILTGKIPVTTEAAKILKERAKKVAVVMPFLDLTSALLASTYGVANVVTVVEKERSTLLAAPKEIGDLAKLLDRSACVAFAANSPCLIGTLIIIIAGFGVFFAVARSFQANVAQRFWRVIYAKTGASPSASNDRSAVMAC